MRIKLKFLCAVAYTSLAISVLGLTGCASGDRFRTAGQYDQDREIAGNIKDALSRAPVYKYPDVAVSVYQGRAQLSGFVATEAQKNQATQIASQVPGVMQVENNLLFKEGLGGAPGETTTESGGSSQNP